MFTLEQLQAILPSNPNCDSWHPVLLDFLPQYDIVTTQRIAAFLSQCAHESGEFRVLRENLNYRWQTLRKVFHKYFPTDELAQEYASRPDKQQAIASRVYANRMGNGPQSSGDGYRYCGRGLIQLTGHDNYLRFSQHCEMPIQEIPDYLESYVGAVHAACWFWSANGLNAFADTDDVVKITRRINGGINGLNDREERYQHALEILGGI